MPITTESELQGFRKVENVSIDARKWQAVRRQMVRLVLGWRHADREISEVLDHCRHDDECPAVKDPSRPCLFTCPDHEIWLSALVIKGNAAQLAMLGQDLPQRLMGEYRPPPREYFDEIVAELETLREGRDILEELRAADKSWAGPGVVDATPMERPTTRLVAAAPEVESITLEDEPPPSSGDEMQGGGQ